MPLCDPNDADLLACLERELRLRRRVYPNLIRNGKMDQDTADHEIRCLEILRDRWKAHVEPDLL